MGHVTYQWVMACINEACHMSPSHVPHFHEPCLTSIGRVPNQWVMSHIKNLCSISTSHVPYQRVTSHISKSRPVIFNANESCPVWMSQHSPKKETPIEAAVSEWGMPHIMLRWTNEVSCGEWRRKLRWAKEVCHISLCRTRSFLEMGFRPL